jgi:hypothetical protein
MTDDIKTLMAFVFQRSGIGRMKEKDVYMMLSFELGWMTPGEALNIIEVACEHGLLIRDSGTLSPQFEVGDVDVPLDFQFSKDSLQTTDEQSLLTQIIEDIVAATKEGEQKIAQEVRQTADRQHILPEVALLVARRHDVPVEPYLEACKERIRTL